MPRRSGVLGIARRWIAAWLRRRNYCPAPGHRSDAPVVDRLSAAYRVMQWRNGDDPITRRDAFDYVAALRVRCCCCCCCGLRCNGLGVELHELLYCCRFSLASGQIDLLQPQPCRPLTTRTGHFHAGARPARVDRPRARSHGRPVHQRAGAAACVEFGRWRQEWEQQQHHQQRWYLMARFVAPASTHASRLHPSLHTPPPHIAHTAALGQHGDGQPPGLWAVRGHAAPVQAAGMSSRWRRGVRSAQDKQCGAASQHHSKLFAAAEFPFL